MSALFDSPFLHDGHIGFCSSPLLGLDASTFGVSDASVESPDRPEAREGASKMNLTGMRFFRLYKRSATHSDGPKRGETYSKGCAGFPPRHVVCSLTSVSDVGGPLVVYVGVSEGNQKSGSLCLSASACSRSICWSAASSASCARVSTVVDENENLRFVPRARRNGRRIPMRSCSIKEERHTFFRVR